jgi:ligand-binding SRPBCC domain-containing protein
MVTIRLNTWVDAPVERCFRLAANVDFRNACARPMKIQAVSGVTHGALREGDSVTWRGWHYGMRLSLTHRIECCRPFSHFREVMVSGVFRYYEHDLHFAVMDDGTRVRDEVRFAAPLGPIGRVLEKLVLKRYLTSLLKLRNAALKRTAESKEWHKYLDMPVGETPETPVRSRPSKLTSLERGVQGIAK